MLKGLILRKLAAVERELGVPLDYAKDIVRTSTRAFLTFAKVFPMSRYRRVLPLGPHHAARLAATREADCGTCLQIEAHLARKAGLLPEEVRAAAEGRPEALPEDLADAWRFSDAVSRATYDESPLREKIRARHGEEGLVEMALAIAACRVFPIVKRALGHAVPCSKHPLAI